MGSQRNGWHRGKTGFSSSFPATKSFSSPIFHRQLIYSSNNSQLNQQKLLLLTPKTHRSLGGNWPGGDQPLTDWDVSNLVPFPSPSCHLALPRHCSPTHLCHPNLLPCQNVQFRRQMPMEGLLWHLQFSCLLHPIPPFFFFPSLFCGCQIQEQMLQADGAGWGSASGWRADKREAGQSW